MLAKVNRLNRAEFTTYFKSGRRFHQPDLTLIYCPSQILKASVVVAKKTAKLAVTRNTLRRQLYGCIEEFTQINQANQKTGVYILITKPTFARLTKSARRETALATLALTLNSR